MSVHNLTLALLGGLILVLGLTSEVIKEHTGLLSVPLFSVAYGVAVGPAGLGLLEASAWGLPPMVLLEQLSRVTIGLAVMTAALRLPAGYVFERAGTMTAVLLVLMPAMWLAVGLLATAILGAPLWICLLVAAALTPTDPVIAGTIVTGHVATENVPERLRHLVSAESAINDGVAYLFVFLPILALEHSLSSAVGEWLGVVLLAEVLPAAVVGFAVGYAVGLLQEWTTRHEPRPPTAMLTAPIVLALGVLGLVKLFGADGILAAFAAGVGFRIPIREVHEEREQDAHETVEWLVQVPLFVVFGTMLPWRAWLELGWAPVAFAAAVLALRRLPIVPVLRRLAPVDRPADALFVGWFGPVGVAAIFYATLAVRETGSRYVWHVCSLVVVASIVAYGVTSTAATKRYGRETGRGDAGKAGHGDDAGETGHGDDAGETGHGDDAGETGRGDDAGEIRHGDDAARESAPRAESGAVG